MRGRDEERTTAAEARRIYFEESGLGADGGYSDAWVDFKVGPFSFPFRNTAGRVRAVRYHDLHHMLTGYRTDLRGEFEISAWELAGGCGRFPMAWLLNLSGLMGGLLVSPGRTVRAFARGCRSRTLYGQRFEPLLARSLASLKAECLPNDDAGPAEGGRLDLRSLLRLMLFLPPALVVALGFLVLVVPMLPWGLWAQRRKAAEVAA